MGDGAFIAGGIYDLESQVVDVFVEGRLDLALFKRRVPGAREMSGPVQAVISLKGTAARPEILGEARLEGGEIFLVSMPERITGLTGSVIAEEGRVELREISGTMGRGTVNLGGSLDWRRGPVLVDVALKARKIPFVLQDTAKALIDTDLSLTGDFEELTLSGKVDFLRARYYREFKDKLKMAPPPAESGKEEKKVRLKRPDWDRMKLDIRVNAADRFWISNSVANVENSLAIHVGGTVREPALDGQVMLLRGEVTYFNRRFELYSGRIFNVPPGIHPVLEAQAEVSVGATRIFLLLEGPLRKPALQLTSVPPYSQEDLLALLTVGHTRSSLEERKGESLAIGAAIIFSTPVIEQMREGAQEVTGIEIFQVEPAFGEDETTARVTVGTQLSDRLYMSASQSIGVTEEQQVKLEYQIFDHFSVLGQQLRQGIYAFDLVFSYDFD
jgi:translocation and assembly module TamB